MTEKDELREQALIIWEVPRSDGKTETLHATAGQALVMVGPNGSGKSALAYWMSVNNKGTTVTRILAQRRVWLRSSGSSVTYTDRQEFTRWFSSEDEQPTSRVRDNYEDQRAASLLFDLFANETGRNADVVKRFRQNELVEEATESVMDKISRIFQRAGLEVTFSIHGGITIDALRKDGVHYPIEHMSDGEKSAFLLAAQVLLAPPASVVIVDEPERHLHRAISPTFVSALTAERPDIAFVFMTHDLDFTSRLDPGATTISILAGVNWTNGTATSWDIQVTPAQRAIPEPVREAVLGGRHRLLLVEGRKNSLDVQLYEILYPDWTIIACGGSADVIRAANGLNTATELHWITAFGIIDGDARTPQESAALAISMVSVLPFNEVESVYYLPQIVDSLARRQVDTLGDRAADILETYKTRALEVLDDKSISHLAGLNTKKRLHREGRRLLNNALQNVIAEGDVELSVPSTYPADRQALLDLIAADDYDAIVQRYSVRDSRLPQAVAKTLRFHDRADYESAVRKRLEIDPDLRRNVTSLLPQLPTSAL
jgi:ABC-type lipoprotein export system ATPase subunit